MWLEFHFRWLQAMLKGQWFIQQMFAEHLLSAPLLQTWDTVVNEMDQTFVHGAYLPDRLTDWSSGGVCL